jgi:hypothetical protein
MSVSKYINFVRLEKAKDTLSKTDLSVREISDQVGFNDYNYFCRVFKKKPACRQMYSEETAEPFCNAVFLSWFDSAFRPEPSVLSFYPCIIRYPDFC